MDEQCRLAELRLIEFFLGPVGTQTQQINLQQVGSLRVEILGETTPSSQSDPHADLLGSLAGKQKRNAQ